MVTDECPVPMENKYTHEDKLPILWVQLHMITAVMTRETHMFMPSLMPLLYLTSTGGAGLGLNFINNGMSPSYVIAELDKNKVDLSQETKMMSVVLALGFDPVDSAKIFVHMFGRLALIRKCKRAMRQLSILRHKVDNTVATKIQLEMSNSTPMERLTKYGAFLASTQPMNGEYWKFVRRHLGYSDSRLKAMKAEHDENQSIVKECLQNLAELHQSITWTTQFGRDQSLEYFLPDMDICHLAQVIIRNQEQPSKEAATVIGHYLCQCSEETLASPEHDRCCAQKVVEKTARDFDNEPYLSLMDNPRSPFMYLRIENNQWVTMDLCVPDNDFKINTAVDVQKWLIEKNLLTSKASEITIRQPSPPDKYKDDDFQGKEWDWIGSTETKSRKDKPHKKAKKKHKARAPPAAVAVVSDRLKSPARSLLQCESMSAAVKDDCPDAWVTVAKPVRKSKEVAAKDQRQAESLESNSWPSLAKMSPVDCASLARPRQAAPIHTATSQESTSGTTSQPSISVALNSPATKKDKSTKKVEAQESSPAPKKGNLTCFTQKATPAPWSRVAAPIPTFQHSTESPESPAQQMSIESFEPPATPSTPAQQMSTKILDLPATLSTPAQQTSTESPEPAATLSTPAQQTSTKILDLPATPSTSERTSTESSEPPADKSPKLPNTKSTEVVKTDKLP
jgi:hypothetical protein